MSAQTQVRAHFTRYMRTGYFDPPYDPALIAAAMESFLPEIDRAIRLCRQDERMQLFREWEIPTKREALIAIVRRMQDHQNVVRGRNQQIDFWSLCKDTDLVADLTRERDLIATFAAKLEELRVAM